MSWYKGMSTYALKMKRLGAKVFNEYREPVLSKEAATSTNDKSDLWDFNYRIWTNRNLLRRQGNCPHDLDTAYNPLYYPPHPQMRELVHRLRQHGLFRDEHKDFEDEMERLRVMKGKVRRVPGGRLKKKSKS